MKIDQMQKQIHDLQHEMNKLSSKCMEYEQRITQIQNVEDALWELTEFIKKDSHKHWMNFSKNVTSILASILASILLLLIIVWMLNNRLNKLKR